MAVGLEGEVEGEAVRLLLVSPVFGLEVSFRESFGDALSYIDASPQ